MALFTNLSIFGLVAVARCY